MITVAVCTNKIGKMESHIEALKKTAGSSDLEFIYEDNILNPTGICNVYNSIVKKSSGDIILFLHDDAFPLTYNWANIIIDKFNRDEHLGMLGVAGSQYMFGDLPLWSLPGKEFTRGMVAHTDENKKTYLTLFSKKRGDFNVVVADGVFFAIKKSIFEKISFDEKTFDGFHFYDMDISFQVLAAKHSIKVTTDILINHLSRGNFSETWREYGKKFTAKYAKFLPVTCSNSPLIIDKKNLDFEEIEITDMKYDNILKIGE